MKIYALANELNLDRSNAGTITVPFGTWDYGQKKLPDGRNLFFRQTLDAAGAKAIAEQIAASVAAGGKSYTAGKTNTHHQPRRTRQPHGARHRPHRLARPRSVRGAGPFHT